MYESGLAYEALTRVNWCPSCKTGLANEEVIKGNCERCGNIVKEKKIRQWILKITEYAEQLLDGLEKLNWPEKVKIMQKNWIGKSLGLEITFKIDNEQKSDLLIYTTCPETIYGVTFIAIAHDHPLLELIIPSHLKESILSTLEIFLNKSKETEFYQYDGIFTGGYVFHPITNRLIPIYVSRYVLSSYGTGAVMGVPAHDQRDYQFAITHNLPIKEVIMDPLMNSSEAYEGDGVLINSNQFDGMNAKTEGRKNISEFLIQRKTAFNKTNYKMRDWIFSRQRYWGEPIPLIHCKTCGIVKVPESELPVVLPHVENYEPTITGESPLEDISEWVNINCYQCGNPAKRETNTMPQWAGSCWYYLRYPDPHCNTGLCSPDLLKKWLPVDLYVGGVEHAILHLLYARFYTKFLYDQKIIGFDEPFLQLFNQGMINNRSEKTGLVEKMSKSKGNIVNPDNIIKKYGIDALRLYIIFIAPPEIDSEWREDGVLGCSRFLNRFWTCMTNKEYQTEEYILESDKAVNLFLKIFNERINSFHTNTSVAAIMEFINVVIQKNLKITSAMRKSIIISCSILIPYICEELLESEFQTDLSQSSWEEHKSHILIENTMTIAIQVNGKFKDTIIIDKSISRSNLEKESKEKVKKWLINISEEEIKIIYVQGKLINFVF